MHCHVASVHHGHYMTSTTTLGSTKRACGSRILKADGCWLLVVCVGVSIALSRSPCLISVLSPCALLPFYLSVVVTVSVPVLGAVVVIAQDPAPALVAVTIFVPAVVGIHACTHACAHDLHTASDCPACAYIPGGNVGSQMCLYQQSITTPHPLHKFDIVTGVGHKDARGR